MSSPAVAAGWYPDPYAPEKLRWWDGTAWTEHVHDPAPTSTPDPVMEPSRPAMPEPVVAEPTIPASARRSVQRPASRPWLRWTIAAVGALALLCLVIVLGFGHMFSSTASELKQDRPAVEAGTQTPGTSVPDELPGSSAVERAESAVDQANAQQEQMRQMERQAMSEAQSGETLTP